MQIERIIFLTVSGGRRKEKRKTPHQRGWYEEKGIGNSYSW